jgi:dihydrofolate reductase
MNSGRGRRLNACGGAAVIIATDQENDNARRGQGVMAKLIYTAIASLDGYVEDEQGGFGWAAPDEEVHAFVNDLERPVGTYLYGRRMYETMLPWESGGDGSDQPAVSRDWAGIWRAAEKVVYSRTLQAVSSARTRIERELDPGAIRRLKHASASDISIGGAGLAGQAIAAGLVDELWLLLGPVLVGGGKPALPRGVRVRLELIGERRFAGGVVCLHYRIRP